MPLRLRVDDLTGQPENEREALSRLRSAEIACFPTDTVYGLGTRADKDEAVQRLYELKGRPHGRPIAVLLADGEDFHRYARLTAEADRLVREHWPGALTVVTPSQGNLSPILSRTGAIGFRCPDLDWLRALIRKLGVPLAATSANRSGEPPARSLDELPKDVLEACGILLDGGRIPEGRPSTVVDCTGPKPAVLRQGEIQIDL